jgi:transcriptional regulator with XRE-family HTH domain
MGRPIKNADHPLARLRAQLSTKNHQMTRAELAERTGVPEPTLKDIEFGKFQLTMETAIRIAISTGVTAFGLLEREKPLLNWRGDVLSPATRRAFDPSPSFLIATRHLVESVCEAADEKNLGRLAAFALERAILKTVDELGLSKLATENLRKRVALFGDEIPMRQYTAWFAYLDEAIYQRSLKRQKKSRSVAGRAA